VKRWREAARGGQLLALENPDRLVRELREIIRSLRTAEQPDMAIGLEPMRTGCASNLWKQRAVVRLVLECAG